MNMECFKEVKFKYRIGFANNYRRIKIKNVVIFPALFSNDGFVGLCSYNQKHSLCFICPML